MSRVAPLSAFPLAIAATLAFASASSACGGATAIDLGDGGAGTDGSSSGSGADGGGSADASSGADSSTSTDGKIACGKVVCDAKAGDYCCLTSPTTGVCMPKNGHNICQGANVQCDDTTDCPPAQRICCLRASNGVAGSGSSCLPSCIMNSETYQLCRVSAECEWDGGGGCVDETCGGRALRTCGAIPTTSCR